MRYTILYIFVLIAAMFASCTNEMITADQDSDDMAISFYISGNSVSTDEESQTRAVDPITEYENYIDASQLKIRFTVDNQEIVFDNLVITKMKQDPLGYQVFGRFKLPAKFINKAASYRIEVYANCGSSPQFNSSLIYSFDPNSYKPSTGGDVKYIPLWGVKTQTLTLKQGNRVEMNQIHLLRSLAKIEINLNDLLLDTYSIESITLNNYNSFGYCLPYNSEGLLETSTIPTLPNVPNNMVQGSNLLLVGKGKQAYVYLPEYLTTNTLNFKINLRNLDWNKVKEYSMTFNPNQKSDFNQIVRNSVYKYVVNNIKDTEELVCNYTVKEWITKDSNVDIDNVNWLWIKDDTLYMNNVAEISTIFDASVNDLTSTISDVKIYKENTAWVDGVTNMGVSITPTLKGTIKITSDIPQNFRGKEFIVTVTSASLKRSATIKVYQFPPLYISADTSGVKWSDTSSQTNKKMYIFTALLPDLRDLPYPDEDDQYVGQDNDYNNYWVGGVKKLRWSLGKVYADSLRQFYAFGFPKTTSSTITGFKSTCTHGADSRKEYTSAIVKTTSGSTDNNRLVSPRFMLASQAGMNTPTSGYNIAITGQDYYPSPKNYCERYREFDENGNDYGPGSWRAPTRAEVYLIDVLQNVKRCEVKKILEGGAYYGGDGVINIFIDPRTGSNYTTAAIRCVRDIK